MPFRAKSGRRAGVTLIELLVVISILLALAVLLVRVLPGVLESRRVREAARLVNVFLGTARNRAVETGRPVAVVFFRDPNLPQACVKLQEAEVPPPYAGDYTDSRIVCFPWTAQPNTVQVCFSGGEFPFPKQFDANQHGEGIVNIGDQFQLNYQGVVWTITGIWQGPPVPPPLQLQGRPTWLLSLSSPTPSPLPVCAVMDANGNRLPLPFQFFRQPVLWQPGTSRAQVVGSLVPPVTLPERTVVDLFYSGTEEHLQFLIPIINNWRAETPVCVVFSPTGAVQGYYYLCPEHPGYVEHYHHAVSPLFFLIGRRDRVTLDLPPVAQYTTPAEDGLFNLGDTNNLWVTVNPQTGMVTTTEVASAPNATLAQARRFAREAQRMGGQ